VLDRFGAGLRDAGHSNEVEDLYAILGHHLVVLTERYAHLRPDLFAAGAHQGFQVDLSATGGDVVGAENGQSTASKPVGRRASS
jgi:hypothetical protein